MRSHAKAASAPSTHRGNRRFSRGVIAVMLVCTAAFVGIGAPAASAAPKAGPGFAFKGSFGSGGFVPLVFEAPRTPVALDGNGNIFAADQLLETVYIFKADEAAGGESLTQFSVGGMPRNMAIDQSTDDVYVDQVSGSVVKRWISDGSPTPTYTVDPSFEVPQGDGIAVDPTSGDLLVADPGAEAVRRYDSSGTLVKTISTPSINPSWLLALPDGSFYVAPAAGPDLTHFSGSGTLLGTIAEVGSLHGLSYDAGRSLIVASVGSKLATYSPAGERLAESGANNGAGIGTAVSSSSRLYEHTSEAINFYAPVVVPGVEAPTVSNVESFGIHVEAEVDPGEKEGGGLPDGSVVHFEYRLAGDPSWTPTPDQSVTAPGSYGTDIALEPNRDYEVRAVAANADISNTSAAVNTTTLVAPPETETLPATDLSETSAVINGRINPFGLQTTYYFEYGPTTAYGTKIPAGIEGTAGNGRLLKSFSRTLSGLTPGMTYHFRLVATNSAGTSQGADRTFNTVAAASIPYRAYEQVTPVDKGSTILTAGIGFDTSPDGNAITYLAKSGPEASPVFSRWIVTRGSNDWQGAIGTDPPLAFHMGSLMTHFTIAVSEDFTHAFVVTNKALAPGAIEGNANLYRRDLVSGAYELVGTSDDIFAMERFTGFGRTDVYQAGNTDLSEIVFYSIPPLLPDAPFAAMYRWSVTGGLELASVLPNGDPTSVVHQMPHSYWQPISADLSRLYFTGLDGSEEGVFLREGDGETKVVSHLPGDPETPQEATLGGTSRDGRYAFLTSGAKLTNDAPGHAEDLYRYDASTDSLEYLGAGAEIPRWSGGFINPPLGIGADGNTIYFNQDLYGSNAFSVWHDGVVRTIRPERVQLAEERSSPSGRYFAFYKPVEGVRTLYRYDAEADVASCVACLADGTPVAANLAPAGPDFGINNRNPAAVGDDGTVYFDTKAPLVAADVNGARDVYEWNDGGARLVSPGKEPFDAVLADVTPSGSDVFFTTAQGLVARDVDASGDLYDARVGGGLPIQNQVPAKGCLSNCKAPPEGSPQEAAVSSETLVGPGNLKPKKAGCRNGRHKAKVKGKTRCVKNGKKHKAGKNKKGGNR